MMITWNETAQRFLNVTDKLGKRIDDGIFETVVALNVLGIGTTQSCEGHMDWGVPYPWINIEPNLDMKYQLHLLLAQFYATQKVNFETILIFHGYRLQSQGAYFSSLLAAEEQAQKLQAYQQEMMAFTAFLKKLAI
jgi:hypothetical protein